MAYQQGQQPGGLSATFVPGGFDDYYMPAPAPELVSPLPQRHMPEIPDQMQENLAHLELEGSKPQTSPYQQPQSSPYQQPQPSPYQQPQSQPNQYQQPHPPQQQQSNSNANPIQAYHHSAPAHPPQAINPQSASSEYSNHGGFAGDLPHFSPFPKLENPPPNVPPSDDEKEAILENARVPVLNSNDPEMQLAWAQDALAYVAAAQTHEERLSEHRPPRPATPAAEHQLRVDAVSIVSFLADQHHPKAEFMKGMWLEFGNFGWRQDKREAFRSYARAAEKGFARAEYRMGMQFEQNNDPVKALTHYQRGAAVGDSASNYRLGMMTLMGQMGQQQDYAKGIHMLQLAAENADENAPQGAYVLGMLQARELPQVTVPEAVLPYNEVEARMNIEKAAYLGFAKAQLKMGSAYELCSLGCEFGPALSLHYNALAARQGEADAEMAISKWFLCGYENIFPKNEELAYEYALRAAQSGLPTAEFALGYFYEIGMHVPVNIQKATEWYEKAASKANEDAINRIEALKESAILSKKDHENVAVNKIKSQYGSMRGKRPDRLRAQAPALPAVQDEEAEYGGYATAQRPGSSGRPSSSGRGTVPPRASTTTPYPINDGPPTISSPPSGRSASVAPYPLDNGPPNVGGRPMLAGGFAPELRSHSAAPAQIRHSSGGAFNINPNIYNQQPDPYSRPPQGQALPHRPATTVGDVGVAQGGRPGGQIGPGNYGRPPYDSYNSQSPPKPPSKMPDIGYTAPSAGGRLNQSPNNLRPQQGPTDIGYVAPLQPKKPIPASNSPSGVTRPPRGSSVQPQQQQGRPQSQPVQAGGRPPRTDSAPTSKPAPVVHANTAPQAGKQPGKQGASGAGKAGVGAGVGAGKPQPHPDMKPPSQHTPGKGPKTFDEMGVPKTAEKGDCVVM